MPEVINRFEEQLDLLISKGELLKLAIEHDFSSDEYKAEAKKTHGKKYTEFVKRLPDFKSDYQLWYTEAKSVIKHVLPDRIDDFISYYEYTRVRKDITFQNYMIRDYLQGLQINRYFDDTVVNGSAAIPEFTQQLNIVKAAKDLLGSVLINLNSILQADLFDSEIDSARALAKGGFLRAAGAVGGVFLEKHLRQICDNHNIPIRKKRPGISDFNKLLRDKDITEISQWRFIQHLADIRNICDHAKDREPKKDEIDDLLTGTEKILKTVF